MQQNTVAKTSSCKQDAREFQNSRLEILNSRCDSSDGAVAVASEDGGAEREVVLNPSAKEDWRKFALDGIRRKKSKRNLKRSTMKHMMATISESDAVDSESTAGLASLMGKQNGLDREEKQASRKQVG